MFDNIGGKIKSYSKSVCMMSIIFFVIIAVIGIVLAFTEEAIEYAVGGVAIAIIGSSYSYVSVFVLYGFGQLIENSDIIVKVLDPESKATLSINENGKKIIKSEKEKMEDISKTYSNMKWEDKIKSLNDEELQERIDNEDWQLEYRALCKKELDSRK